MNKLTNFLALFILALPSYAVTTLDITTATLKGLSNQKSCLRYKIEPKLCVWASLDGYQTFTPYISHYIPDLVISVYRNENENPWIEANKLYDTIPNKIRDRAIPTIGSGNSSLDSVNDNNLYFKEADVIGNPAVSIFLQRIPFVSLSSTTNPGFPYYLSVLDTASWRGLSTISKLEEKYSISTDITHHVGGVLTYWGGIFPHQGFVSSNDDGIASMVVAQRAADLLSTNMSFDHIRRTISESCGESCKASPIKENSSDTLFQRIYPDSNSTCEILGSDGSYSDAMLNHDEKYQGSYMWIVWRKYEGCVQGDGKFIGVINK